MRRNLDASMPAWQPPAMSEDGQPQPAASQTSTADQDSARHNRELVAVWLQEQARSVAYQVRSPEAVRQAWAEVKAEAAEDGTIPLLGKLARKLGFAEESGLAMLIERGRRYAEAVKQCRQELVDLIICRMMTGKANQVGCIFWLKNCAGWRDRTPEEAKEERDDWLARLQVARTEAAAADRADAPPDSGPSLQLPGTDDLTADADFDPPSATPAITAKSA